MFVELKAPRLEGIDASEVQKFMGEWFDYKRDVKEKEVYGGGRLIQRSLASCIAESALEYLMAHEMGVGYTRDNVTDESLEECLGKIISRFQMSAAEAVGLLRRKIRYDLRVKDPYARVGQMFMTLSELTRLHGLESVWNVKRNQRMCAEIIIEAVQPPPLRETLKQQIVQDEVLQDMHKLMLVIRERVVQYEIFRPQLTGSNAGESRRDGQPPRRRSDRSVGRGTRKAAAGNRSSERKSSSANASKKPSNGRPGRQSSDKKSSCWFCGASDHQLADCPDCDEQKKAAVRKAMISAYGDSKRQRGNNHRSVQHGASQTTKDSEEKNFKEKPKGQRGANRKPDRGSRRRWTPVINQKKMTQTKVHLDSGADVTIMSMDTVQKFNQKGSGKLQLKTVTSPLEVQWIDGTTVMALDKSARVDLTLSMPTGDLTWRDHEVFIQDLGKDEIWVSRPAMEEKGIDVYQVAERIAGDSPKKPTRKKIYKKKVVGGSTSIDDGSKPEMEIEELLAEQDIGNIAGVDRMELEQAKSAMIDRARKHGVATEKQIAELRKLVNKHDIWRIQLGEDPPVAVEPMGAHLRSDAVPVSYPPRRLSTEKRDFLKKITKQLEDKGLIRRVLQSEWGHPVVIVAKPGNRGFRMTVDLRGLNKQTVPIAQALTDLESSSTMVLREAKVYGQLDAFKGFWQLPLAQEAQLCHSIVTPWGIYVPTRVLQGNTNSAGFFQSAMQELFSDLLDNGLQVYIDDLLVYGASVTRLWELYDRIFAICARKGLKLSPEKCELVQTKVLWCGREISAEGIRFNPKLTAGLEHASLPATAGDLMHFLAALGWMQIAFPQYEKTIGPMQDLLNKCLDDPRCRGRRTKQAASRVTLEGDYLITEEVLRSFNNAKELLRNQASLDHPRSGYNLQLFTDASDEFWSVMLSQTSEHDKDLPVEKRHHRPLAFLSGRFRDSSSRWTIQEKETYAVIAAVKRLDYLLDRPFDLYTDNRNLSCCLDNPPANKTVGGKIARWTQLLNSYRYSVHHLPGSTNLWADMLSRPTVTVGATRQIDFRARPAHHPEFTWPSLQEIDKFTRDYVSNARLPTQQQLKKLDQDLRRVRGGTLITPVIEHQPTNDTQSTTETTQDRESPPTIAAARLRTASHPSGSLQGAGDMHGAQFSNEDTQTHAVYDGSGSQPRRESRSGRHPRSSRGNGGQPFHTFNSDGQSQSSSRSGGQPRGVSRSGGQPRDMLYNGRQPCVTPRRGGQPPRTLESDDAVIGECLNKICRSTR